MNVPPFPPNPNLGRNRVPGSEELATVRTIVEQSEDMLKLYDSQVEMGQKRYESIYKRYKQQQEDLQCILSELYAVSDFVKTARAQKEYVQNSLKQWRGLINPIRRCNDDVLQCILEWTFQVEGASLRAATKLSYVCQRWRRLALQTPSFWSKISIRTNRRPAAIKSYWQRSLKRLTKGIPPTIRLELCGSDSEQEILDSLNLGKLAIIHKFRIVFQENTSATRLASQYFRSTTVDRLILYTEEAEEAEEAEADEFGEPPRIIVDMPKLVSGFRKVASLEVSGGVTSFIIDSQHTLPEIKTLKLGGYISNPVSLAHLTRMFPNIETLELVSLLLMLENSQDAPWPMLQSLILGGYVTLPWNLLQFPNLSSLSFYEYPVDDNNELSAFLTRHSSLRQFTLLDKPFDDESYLSLIRSAPNLENITISYCESLGDPSSINLGGVRDLSVRFSSPALAPSEKIRKNLFSHTTSDSTQHYAMLRILYAAWLPQGKNFNWIDSELASQALENVTEIVIWDMQYTSYNFKLLNR